MAAAAAAVTFSSISSSSSPSSTITTTTTAFKLSITLRPSPSTRFLLSPPFSSLSLRCTPLCHKWLFPRLSAVVEEEQVASVEETAAEEEEEEEEEEEAAAAEEEEEEEEEQKEEEVEEGKADEGKGKEIEVFKLQTKPCELYVCNLPRSCDISELLELFKPYGTVLSVEVSRNAETGISRGCGFVTLNSLGEAKAAIFSLDGSDLGGREIRVKFSADMASGRKNSAAQNTTPKKNMVFESPYKAYVGNLAWSVTVENLREHFSQFGSVVSARLLQDKKSGKNRVYGFVSFSSEDEMKAAAASSGTVFNGRTMLVREVVKY